MAQLRERNEKKQKEAEEKEQRKKERVEKKQQKEEEKMSKAKDRARKAEEKKKIAEEKTKKAAERCRNRKQGQGTSKAATLKVQTTRRTSDQGVNHPRVKRVRLSDLDGTLDSNRCCACFSSYDGDVGTGREWLQCGCGRWIHEECVEDVREDNQSRDMICPLCLSV